MLEEGFRPDVISSDVHALCIDGPAFDLLVTMSKFLCLGMPLAEVVRAATATPTRAMGRSDLGALSPGAVGDAAVLELQEGSFAYADALGRQLTGGQRLVCRGIVTRGDWWPDDAGQAS